MHLKVAVYAATLLCCAPLSVAFTVTSCLPPGATSLPNEPRKPQIPNSYRVKIAVTTETLNITEQMEEIVDGLGNRALLRRKTKGSETDIYFLYDTQEILYVTGDTCKVQNFTSDPDRFIFFGESLKDGRGHIPDGPSTLYFGKNITTIYKGSGVMVMGVSCDWWQSCLVFNTPDSGSSNITIDYYFSVASWGTTSLFQQVPVRYDMYGTYAFANGTQTSMHVYYDFFDFMAEVESDTTMFETPEGVACPGRKHTQDLPPLYSGSYHFQEELVNFLHGVISQAEVWFDGNSKLVRVDYRSPTANTPLKTLHPLSAVHDYNFGVSYVKDLETGECFTRNLAENSFDGRVNEAAFRQNGSYVMSMKTPRTFFFLDSNFTYSGQRRTRDVLCDVYISERNNFDLFNNGSALNAKVEVYFLVDGWSEFSNAADEEISTKYPIRVEVWIPKMEQNVVYNVFDFDTERPDPAIFDVTDCYNASASLRIRLCFTGPYFADLERYLKDEAQSAIASSLNISPLRVNNLQLEHDANYVYLTFTLLDRTPSLAQFTHLPNAVTETEDDLAWSNITTAGACSDLCVDNPDFRCESFEFCPLERGGTCRISTLHIGDGTKTVVPGTCSLYSRTVNVASSTPELTAQQAYHQLQEQIKEGIFYFSVSQGVEEIRYAMVDSEIIIGTLQQVPMPSLTAQFSYRVEMVFPRDHQVETYDIWYDSVSHLIRSDKRDIKAGPPYYTPFTVSYIHDYNTGISYSIDSHRGNCTVGPIPANVTFGVHPLNWTQVEATGIEILTMKTPLEFFYLDKSYIFTGQKTVRGILCNVFESQRTDFSVGQGQENSIFKYYFQAENWLYEADSHDDVTSQQPVQLSIMDLDSNEFIIYNFYDFNDEHSTYDKFDISPCFTDEQRVDFVIEFNHTYHPFLDTAEWMFKQELQLALTNEINVSPLRIQNMEVTYNLDRTYVIMTLLGQVSPQLHFAEVGTSSPYKSQVAASRGDLINCAAACYYSNDVVCNSFDLCPDQWCYISTNHVPDGPVTNSSVTCRHFSRLTNGKRHEPTLDDAFTAIKDLVYKGLLIVSVQSEDGTQSVSFPALDVRDSIFQINPNGETGGTDLRSKFKLYKTGYKLNKNAVSMSGMAVDECATSCLNEMFPCNAFTYCYTTGDCLLNVNRPANNQDIISDDPFCDIYSRLYVDDYTPYKGWVIESAADKVVMTTSTEDCARQCSETTSFTCRSFDTCPSTGECLLHQRHKLFAPLRGSSLCSHYSRSYIADFSLQAHKVIPGNDTTVLEGIPIALCAYRCVDEDWCQSFEFCSGVCHFSSVLPSTTTALNDSQTCDLYSLKANASAEDRGNQNRATTPRIPPSTPNTPERPTNPATIISASTSAKTPAITTPTKMTPSKITPSIPTPSSGGHNSGGTGSTPRSSTIGGTGCSDKQTNGKSNDTGPRVGIAVGMLVAGLLLGVGLVLLVQKLMSKRNDDAMELMPRMR